MIESILAPLVSTPQSPLCRAVNATPESVSVSLLYQGKLPDSSQVFVANDAYQRPRAIVLLSSESSPDMVARSVRRAREAVASIGPLLGRAVLQPSAEGAIEGRTYAITPYCLPFSSSRVRWYLERARLRPVIFDWLHKVAATTAMPVDAVDRKVQYEQTLQSLASLDGVSAAVRRHAQASLDRLSSGAWVPRHVLMHGDLWKGNLLLRRADPGNGNASWADRIAVIDWAGAKTQGYPVFDLVRVAGSIGARGARLRAEIDRHCAVLRCEPQDAVGYLLAALGSILGELEEFPMEQFVLMTESSFKTLLGAVPSKLQQTDP